MELKGSVKKTSLPRKAINQAGIFATGLLGYNNPERLLNLYSIWGPKNIDNRHFPNFPYDIRSNGGNMYKANINRILAEYGDRQGYNNKFLKALKDIGLDVKADTSEGFVESDFFTLPNYIAADGSKMKEYMKVFSQLSPYYDGDNIGVRGTYNNTLPKFMQKFTHPLNINYSVKYE